MIDLIIVGIVLIIVGSAVAYIVKEKKRGVKCIGCPAGGNCSRSAGGCMGCSGHSKPVTDSASDRDSCQSSTQSTQ